MRVAVVQTNPRYLNVDKNLQAIETLLKPIKADLIVLPELCSSGYNFQNKKDLAKVAESAKTGKTSVLLSRIAQKKNAAIVAGFPERDKSSFYNSALIVKPRAIEVYRKTHLFFKEKKFFKAGSKVSKIYQHKGAKFGVMICFDWFFPEVSRSLSRRGAQIIAHPSNLVLPYAPKGMAIRSLENLVYSVTSNRVGREFNLSFIGSSQILDTRGHILTQLSKSKPGLSVVNLNPNIANNKKLTKFNNITKDRRPAIY